MVPHSRLSVSALSSFRWSFEEDFALWRELGVGWAGLIGQKLEPDVAGNLARLADAGIRVSTVIAAGFDLAAPATWDATREALAGWIDAAAAQGGWSIYITPGRTTFAPWAEVLEIFAEATGPSAAHARARGVRLAFEPSQRPDVSFINTLRDGDHAAQRTGLGMVVDFGNCWMERDFREMLLAAAPRIALVQVGDVPVRPLNAPGGGPASGRVPFGEGDLPLARMLGDVRDTGYAGPLELELPGPLGETEGYAAVIRRGVEKASILFGKRGCEGHRGENAMNVQQSIAMLPTEEAAKLVGRGPVSSRPYHDPAWWELERKAIFLRSWIHIGHVCEVPEAGSFIRREVEFAKASLLIMRGKDGAVRAFHNVCTHRGTQLTQESCGRKNTFSCPYHMWTFGSDGALLSAPDFERFYVEREDMGLKAVATEVLAGMIFVNFDPAPRQSARAFFGPIADELETLPVARAVDFTEWVYEIPANWKTNYDNFQENYHLRFIHPQACDQAAGPDNPFGYPTHYGFSGPHRSQRLWKNPAPPPPTDIVLQIFGRGAALAAADGPAFAKMDFKLFPGLHVVALPPGQQWTHTHYPLGPDCTRGVIRMYWTKRPDSASRLFFQETAMASLRDVLSQDRHAVEAAQAGLSSGAIERIHFQDHEMLLRHQYETVEAIVAAYVAEQEAAGV